MRSLEGFRALLDREFGNNLALHAPVEASSFRGKAKQFSSSNVTDSSDESYWATDDDVTTGTIEIGLEGKHTVKYILLQEYITLGQRVESFSVEVWKEGRWEPVAKATTIGYKRILKIDPIETDRVKINFAASKASLVISNIEVY